MMVVTLFSRKVSHKFLRITETEMVKVGDDWDKIVTAVDTVCHYCAEKLTPASPATLLKI